ncbi:MAG: hypothetical protein KAH38_08490 [Candidatus Hydrogenedentes bacterium]|nr:hypothetical protein [Candidatus Hydrogenedentota bacterium]
MASIERMERGKLCRMAGRSHYNLQAWRKGKNEVRYVRQEEVETLQEAIDGYNLFMTLAQQYADLIITRTRRNHKRRFSPKNNRKNKIQDKPKIGQNGI